MSIILTSWGIHFPLNRFLKILKADPFEKLRMCLLLLRVKGKKVKSAFDPTSHFILYFFSFMFCLIRHSIHSFIVWRKQQNAIITHKMWVSTTSFFNSSLHHSRLIFFYSLAREQIYYLFFIAIELIIILSTTHVN